MLNSIELLLAITSGWVVSILSLIVIRRNRGKKLPKGAIVLESGNLDATIKSGYDMFLITGMGLISFLNFFVVFLCVFNFWDLFSQFIAFDFPNG